MGYKWIALGMLLAGCDGGAQRPVGVSSTATASVASAAVPVTTGAPRVALLKRKSTPVERRKADENACLSGDLAACKRMADRFRGYGHPAGCGVERKDEMSVELAEGTALKVRIKRTREDTDADTRGFLQWIGKACDLGDEEACKIEKAMSFTSTLFTAMAEDACLRSDPGESALWSWQKATRAQYLPLLEDARKDCLSHQDEWRCSQVKVYLYRREEDISPKALTPELREQAEGICGRTLDCDAVVMMLDKNGYGGEGVAAVRQHAAKVLVEACLEGSCVCGEAAKFVSSDDPRMVDLAQLGCENGEAEGCYTLGRLYEEGRGVTKNEGVARALYEAACPPMRPKESVRGPRLGEYSPRACDRLAEIYEGGTMPPKDMDRARYYAEFGCLRPGFERDHAPCVRLSRYWASNPVVTGRNAQEAELRFYGPNSTPVYGKECERPSVKELCKKYEKEIVAVQN